MSDFLFTSLYFGVFISLGTYMFGMWLKSKLKLEILNPILTSALLTISLLLILDIDYETYNETAKYLTYLLTPATVCLAIPLYEKVLLLKKHLWAVLISAFAGVIANGICIFLLSIIFNLTETQFATLIPKSITTAMGIGVSNELGGMENLTVAAIVFTGIFGTVTATFVLKLFKITHPIAKGLAIGTSAHALGTSKAIELGEIEGAMSGLAIAVCGLMTVVIAPLLFSIY